jgi:hypothetical protein
LKISSLAWLAAAGEEVALQNFSANTRPVFVAIIGPHRALLQNFHHNHIHLLLNFFGRVLLRAQIFTVIRDVSISMLKAGGNLHATAWQDVAFLNGL